MKKNIFKVLAVLILGICVGIILLLIATVLPNESVKKNLKESNDVLISEGYEYNVGINNKGGRLDNFTDSIILFVCANDRTTSVVEHAMNAEVVKNAPIPDLYNFIEGNDVISDEYARYWHGYQVILKPVLSVLNYSQVRSINFVLQILLVLCVVFMLYKKKMFGYILAYVLAYIAISPQAVGKCMQFSPVFYISNFAVLILLLFPDYVKKNNIYYFMVIGMLTSYFDLLTYPVLTLGLPLIFFIDSKNNDKWNIKDIFINSILWGIGYAGMWVGKWIVGSILLHRNILLNASEAAMHRTSMKNGHFDIVFAYIFTECFEEIPFWILLVCMIVIFIPIAIVERKIALKKKYLLVISLIPFAWASVLRNHTYVHSWFTYRIFSIFVLCIISFILYNLYNYIKQEKMNANVDN